MTTIHCLVSFLGALASVAYRSIFRHPTQLAHLWCTRRRPGLTQTGRPRGAAVDTVATPEADFNAGVTPLSMVLQVAAGLKRDGAELREWRAAGGTERGISRGGRAEGRSGAR